MLSMNGICAEKMQNSGFNYGKNFGVSWDRLCEIASAYEQNWDLAIRLWNIDIRETKLIATKICSPEMLNEKNIYEWISGMGGFDQSFQRKQFGIGGNYIYTICKKHYTYKKIYRTITRRQLLYKVIHVTHLIKNRHEFE